MSIWSTSKYKRIQKAREEDAKNGSKAVAMYLLTQGLNISKIAYATGLTLTEIEKLSLEYKKNIINRLKLENIENS
jgi:hypothetical protein